MLMLNRLWLRLMFNLLLSLIKLTLHFFPLLLNSHCSKLTLCLTLHKAGLLPHQLCVLLVQHQNASSHLTRQFNLDQRANTEPVYFEQGTVFQCLKKIDAITECQLRNPYTDILLALLDGELLIQKL